MLNDFKAFLLRGNVVDLAVAIVVGVAFTAVVTAFVSWLAWPPAAYLITVIRLFAGLPVASVDLRGIH